jgi:hypothetical protein
MEVVIIIGIVILVIIIINISSNNRRQKEEIARQARLKREREEKEEQQRLEDLKYETVEVVFAYIYEDKKPRAAVKRSDNTYNFVEREKPQFTIGQEIKLLKEKTNFWNWIDEQEYQRKKAIEQQKISRLNIERKKIEELKQREEKIVGTKWNVTQPATDLKDEIFEFCPNGVLKHGNKISKWELKDEQIVISHNGGYATLTGQITDDIISGRAYNIVGKKWIFSGKQILDLANVKISVKPKQQEDSTGKQTVEKQNQYLDRFGINYFYHMTHIANLGSILQLGLKSHNDARKNNLMKNDIANSDVNDRRSRIEPIHNRSLHDYVPLYFNPQNSMLFVRKNIQNDIVILAIDRMLICSENVVFTDGNAANKPTRFFNSINNLNRINWKCIRAEFWNDFEDGKRERMAEVLVYPDIPVRCIQKIYCNNLNTLQFLKETIKNYPHIEAELNRSLYFK